MIGFTVKALHGSAIINERDDDVAVVCHALLAHHEIVSIVDTGLDHRFAVNREQKRCRIANDINGKRDGILDVLNQFIWSPPT